MTLGLTAPETAASPASHRIFSFTLRALSYLACTVVMLYAGNLNEDELPRRRLAWLMGLLAIYTVVGGLGGTSPTFQFNAALSVLVPHSVQQGMLNQGMLHPSLAQIQNVLGTAAGRPDAPYDYTNTWGNCLAILAPWLIVAWYVEGTRRQRWIAAAALVLSVIPIVYSLNRGLWLALIVAVIYLAVRLAARGRLTSCAVRRRAGSRGGTFPRHPALHSGQPAHHAPDRQRIPDIADRSRSGRRRLAHHRLRRHPA